MQLVDLNLHLSLISLPLYTMALPAILASFLSYKRETEVTSIKVTKMKKKPKLRKADPNPNLYRSLPACYA